MMYQKGDPQLDVGQPRQVATSAVSVDETRHLPASPVGYSKGDAVLIPKAFLVVFSGGLRRELDYFKVIEQNPEKFPGLKLDFFVEDRFKTGHVPLVYQLALDKVDEYNTSSSPDAPDVFYVVTDVDLFLEHIQTYKPLFEAKKIGLIVNNPCLEVWLYYSKCGDKFEGFVFPVNPEALSSAVKTFVHSKTGGVSPRKAIFDIEVNIVNARNNYDEDANGIPSCFSTNMFLLAERMLPLLRPGLNSIKTEREALRRMWLEQSQ